MVILIDTNIIIDALADREPYATDAKQIMEICFIYLEKNLVRKKEDIF